MGHRSSKLSAGLTNGNKSSIKETTTSSKLSKHSSHRHSSRFPKSSSPANSEQSNKIYRNSVASLTSNNVAAVYGDKFLPILRLDSDSIAESSNLSSVTSSSSGQIIIKIHFKTHSPSEMDNAQQNLVDTNSNKLTHTTESAGVVEAAGSSINSMLNNNNTNNSRTSLPNNLNLLRITEPLAEQEADGAGNVEYYEVAEDNTAVTQSRSTASSRRQKAKSAFMNFKSMLESSSSSSCKTRLSNSNNNNHSTDSSSNHSRNNTQMLPVSAEEHLRQKQFRPASSDVRMSLPTPSSSSFQRDSAVSNVNSMTTSTSHTPTPVSITTSNTAQPPTNDQLAFWASNKDLIISSINVVVCPTPATPAVTVTATTSKSADRVPTTANRSGIRNENALVGEEKCSSNQQRDGEVHEHTNMPQTSATKKAARVLSTATSPIVHSQIDFVHYLVPDLERIFNSSFYWGKMDRYEAERLLEGKPEGTFLLRDSAQEEYLFSVTFRKYGRSLHARIEQSGHKFSFDSHDPAVFSTSTVTGLLEHYKDPGSVMFFEPMLTVPFHRKKVFSLQQLARAAIVSNTTYDGVTGLELPVCLKSYLKEYHYKQKLRVKLLDERLLTYT
ncbi:uncharacterized protein LOC105218184 [Zeugodacus cucurbitae]|uniref:uncharacterized protein LOC105218184 n=1 Tax=Zeugodacus cucurbitae TaxID=28588 RepID=UPI0023D8E37A|nr:uncharacterized protein LOC105218184 [Zeugodacus cucurbitae]XP_011191908.2 uncharacterized protein LOC105218184 [Zeugodacus cucurbitae]